MSEAESGTHPVYIDRELKKQVKMESTEKELTMREVTERLIERGMEEGFHDEPLPSEFDVDIEDIRNDVERAVDDDDLDRALDRLDGVQEELDAANFFEEDAAADIQAAIDHTRDGIAEIREDFAEDDE